MRCIGACVPLYWSDATGGRYLCRDEEGRLCATRLAVCVLGLCASDVLFAMDSVPARLWIPALDKLVEPLIGTDPYKRLEEKIWEAEDIESGEGDRALLPENEWYREVEQERRHLESQCLVGELTQQIAQQQLLRAVQQ